MSKIEVDEITQQSGTTVTVGGGSGKTAVLDATTVTIGRCGGTVALASGASQTGFGRTGTVNWQTGSIKTSTFTAANGEGYFVDTSSGGFTVNMPASPSAGNIVAFCDYAGVAATNNITIDRNSSPFQGGTSNGILDKNREAVTFVYVDGTQGWVPVNDNAEIKEPAQFVAATGGTVTTVDTDFKVHTFTGPGTFCVSDAGNSEGSNTVSYVVVAGGGSGTNNRGGGGGAGGFRESKAATDTYTASPLNATSGSGYNLPVTATGFPITVGGGGASIPSSPTNVPGINGSNSSFSTITSAGGGGGHYSPSPSPTPGVGSAGGSGGGSGYPGKAGGAGNTPPVSPPQGNPGGNTCSSGNSGSGGGGAGAAGGNAGPSVAGDGGAGVASTINGTPTTRAGGGGGSGNSSGGAAGPGGGGAGFVGPSGSNPNDNGTDNTGGGGGASRNGSSGSGGSGIVIIRYKFQ